MTFRFWCPLKLNSFCNFCIVCDYFYATKAELTACDTLGPKMFAYLWFKGQIQTSLCKGILCIMKLTFQKIVKRVMKLAYLLEK